MSNCAFCHPRHDFFGAFGIPLHRHRRLSGDGFCETGGRQVCHPRRFFNGHAPCRPLVKRVTCIRPTCNCNDPVVIEVTGMWNELAANNCWELVFCPNTLEMSSTAPVVLTDGDQDFLLIEGFSGNTVKYDQLTRLVDWRHDPAFAHCWRNGEIVLRMFFANDGPMSHRLQMSCNSLLPRSTHVPKIRPADVPPVEEAVV